MDERIRFIATFLPLYFTPLFLIAFVLPLGILTDAIALAESFLLAAAGIPNQQYSSVIVTQTISYEVIPECTGLTMIILLFALLYSTKMPEQKRRSALLLFAPLLFAFNIFRLFAVMWTGIAFGQAGLEYSHPAFWLLDAGIVFAIWYSTIQSKQ